MGADLHIAVAARQLTIQRVADKDLHTVGKAAAADGNRAVQQSGHAKFLIAKSYDIADGKAGLLDGFSAVGEGDGIFDKAARLVQQ